MLAVVSGLLVGRGSAMRATRSLARGMPLLAASSSSSTLGVSTSTSTPRLNVRRILASDADSIVGKSIVVRGWVRTVRDQKKFACIEVNDGSSLTGIQCVADESIDS